MGHSQKEKTKSHERIVRTASKRFRESGLKGVGIGVMFSILVFSCEKGTAQSQHRASEDHHRSDQGEQNCDAFAFR